MAPPPDFARRMSSAVDGRKLMALAMKILSCLKSLVIWALGTADTPMSSTTIAMTLIGPAAAADPSAAPIGSAKAAMAPAIIALDKTETEATVGARASMSRSARIRQDETPSSAMLDTMT